jgi:hypothetical protein
MEHVNAPFQVSKVRVLDHDRLQPKPLDFMSNLFETGNEQCIDYIGSKKVSSQDFKFCKYEVMVAASCVLLNKTNNMLGDMRDNVHICKSEIALAKKNLNSKFESFPNEKFDKWLRSLSFATKSFC